MPFADAANALRRSAQKMRSRRRPGASVARERIAASLGTLATLGEAFSMQDTGDDLTVIRGIGDVTAEAFRKHGVRTFRDLATVNEETVRLVDEEVPGVARRIETWRTAADAVRRTTPPTADAYRSVVRESQGRSFATSGERRGIVRHLRNVNGTARTFDFDLLAAPAGTEELRQAVLDLPSVGGVARVPFVSSEDAREARFIGAAVRGGAPLDEDLAERLNSLSARTGYDFTHAGADDEVAAARSAEPDDDRARLASPNYFDQPPAGRFVEDQQRVASAGYDDAPTGGRARYQELPVAPGYQELRKANVYQNPEQRSRYEHLYLTPRHEPQATSHPDERPVATSTYDELDALRADSPEYDDLDSLLPDAERSRSEPASTGTRVQGASHYQPARPIGAREAREPSDREPPTVEGPAEGDAGEEEAAEEEAEE